MNLKPMGWFNWFIAIFMIVVILRACSAERRYEKLVKVQGQKHIPNTPLMQEAEELSREIDSAGREKVVYRMSDPIIQKIVDTAQLDSIARIANVRADRITAVTQVNGELVKENTDLKRKIEEINGQSDTIWNYSDEWISLSGRSLSDTVFRIDSLRADASVSKIDHSRRKYWLWGRPESLTTIYYESPYLRVRGLKSGVIKQPDPFISFDLNVQGLYLHTPQELLIGPRGRIGLGRFGVTGGYLVNPNGKIGNTVWYGADWKIY